MIPIPRQISYSEKFFIAQATLNTPPNRPKMCDSVFAEVTKQAIWEILRAADKKYTGSFKITPDMQRSGKKPQLIANKITKGMKDTRSDLGRARQKLNELRSSINDCHDKGKYEQDVTSIQNVIDNLEGLTKDADNRLKNPNYDREKYTQRMSQALGYYDREKEKPRPQAGQWGFLLPALRALQQLIRVIP